MRGECHAHMIMDGANYKKAVLQHADGVRDDIIRTRLKLYQDAGISFVRDGGDALGVSSRAAELAPEFGIDYRTPAFAIHKEGHYGKIVGKSWADLKEFHQRELEAKAIGADFIKIMTTGILDFGTHGEITGEPLDAAEVREMVHIAHEEGFAVMSHTNGSYGVRAAIEAGVDSLEHGNYMDDETIEMLAESNTVWVPTLVTVRNLIGCGRYDDSTIRPIADHAHKAVVLAFEKGAKIAPGSDAGAYMVPHAEGLKDEYQAFAQILGDQENVYQRLEQGVEEIRRRFRRPRS